MRVTDQGDIVLSSVHKPSVTAYIPPAKKSIRVAVICNSGGVHTDFSDSNYNITITLPGKYIDPATTVKVI
jgi:hypothetical protein